MSEAPAQGATGRSTSSWLNPTGFRAALLLVIIAALANGVWILLDSSAVAWDQSHYLDVTWHYELALSQSGIRGLLHSIHTADPSHGPLFTILMLPFLEVFGDSARSGLILNFLLAPVLYLCTGEIAMEIFRDWRARLIAIVLVATMPLMVGLEHNVLVDYLLVTLATVSILLLLKTRRFDRRGIAILMGVAMALGELTKVTFPAFVIGPILIVVGQVAVEAWRTRGAADQGQTRKRVTNIGLALATFLVLTLPWYIPNLSQTLDYIRSTTGGPLALGAGPTHPLTFHAITSFTLGVVNGHVGWIVGLAAIVVFALNLPTMARWLRRPLQSEPLVKAAFLLAWVLIPYLSVALSHNQDPRLMSPAVPGIAVMVAGGMAAVRSRELRLALVGATTLALVYQTTNRVTSLDPSFLPRQATVTLGTQSAVLPLAGSAPMGYEQLPGKGHASQVLDYIESVASSGRIGDPSQPRTICMLESEPMMNSNTLGFLSDADGDPFGFADVVVGSDGRAGLAKVLTGCDFAIYSRPPHQTRETAGSRLNLVNDQYAAAYMTPALFRTFKGPSRTFVVPELPPDADPSAEGLGDRVRVLVRDRAAPVP